MQDRDWRGQRTPRWRGVTLLHELRRHAIPVALASDNTRDQFYAYGDLDMLEVFNQVCILLSRRHQPSGMSSMHCAVDWGKTSFLRHAGLPCGLSLACQGSMRIFL